MNINTTKNVTNKCTALDLTNEIKDMETAFQNAEMVEVMIPDVLASKWGNPYQYVHQGVLFTFVMNQSKMVPKEVAQEIQYKMKNAK